MKRKDMGSKEKMALVQECIELIGDKWNELCFKHDGCRILQSLVKYGNPPQRTVLLDQLKGNFVHLMQQKYSHYLASKMYSFAPGDALKDEFRLLARGQINKLILHAYASEVVEFIYSTDTNDNEKRRMVFSLYGNFTLMLDEILQSTKNASLKVFIE